MTFRALIGLLVLSLTPSIACAITSGQIDTFQDGTTDNWTNGGTPPVNIPTGGPAGAGDNFLQLTADGGGSNGKLTTFNRTQWLGNYVAAGVTEIDMDLENLGSVTLSIRLAFRGATFNGAPGYLSTTQIVLAAGSGWQHAQFFIDSSSLMPIGNPAVFTSFFATGPAEFRIINEAGDTNLDGDAVTSQLGIDNVRAVPEPATLILMVAGFCFVMIRGLLKTQFTLHRGTRGIRGAHAPRVLAIAPSRSRT